MPKTVEDWLKLWPVAITIVGCIYGYSTLNTRVETLSDRQDRQGTAITTLQSQSTEQAQSLAELKATVDGISDNVSYIRSRIDSIAR